MPSDNQKAIKEEELGDKALKSFFGGLFGNKYEDAADHFIKAAALYKISKDWEESGRCYRKAAEANLKAKNEIEAVQNYKDAGKMYIHCNPKKAMEMYKYAIQFYLESNKFAQAAKLQEQIGDMLLEENNVEEAIEAYEECADLFKTENQLNQMNKRLQKVAHLSAKLGRYERSIQIFESVANHNVDNNLLRWNVKNLLFKGMICQINNYIQKNKQEDEDETKEDINNEDKKEKPTIENLEETFKTYCDLSDIFASSKEAKLIDSILKAIPNSDMDSFKQAVHQYDKIIRLEAWCTEQLLVIERFMQGELTKAPDLNDFGDDNNNNNNNNDNNTNNKKEQGNGMNPFDFDKDDGPELNNAPNLDEAPDL